MIQQTLEQCLERAKINRSLLLRCDQIRNQRRIRLGWTLSLRILPAAERFGNDDLCGF